MTSDRYPVSTLVKAAAIIATVNIPTVPWFSPYRAAESNPMAKIAALGKYDDKSMKIIAETPKPLTLKSDLSDAFTASKTPY